MQGVISAGDMESTNRHRGPCAGRGDGRAGGRPGGGSTMRVLADRFAAGFGRSPVARAGVAVSLGGVTVLLALSPAVAGASPGTVSAAATSAAGGSVTGGPATGGPATGGPASGPAATGPSVAGQAAAAPAPPSNAECVRKFVRVTYPKTGFAACYTPLQLQRAYGLRRLYARGFDGRGRTIVVADPFGSPTIRHDLAVFDRAFHLPAPPSFRILQPAGPVPPFNAGDALMRDKAGETTLDVEVAHAMAPGAGIALIETPGLTSANVASGGGYPQLMAAENYVIEHNLGDVITQSFSLPEQTSRPATSSGCATRTWTRSATTSPCWRHPTTTE